MRSLLLWMLGVPIPVIILIAIFMHSACLCRFAALRGATPLLQALNL